jgi:RHS repeat-associated protein
MIEQAITLGASYYRARYYDPSVGRFLSEDLLGFLSGDANFYSYVQNDSTSLSDPDGLSPEGCTHTCVRRARVIAGNPDKVGKQGGVLGNR